MKKLTLLTFLVITILFLAQCSTNQNKTGSVIFIHPDGTGLTNWNITRIIHYGPDGLLNWDKMPHMALYKSHMKDCLSAASHGGATIHAYGVKVKRDSYGMNGTEEVISASGKKLSIMHEAMEGGLKIGLVNSGSIIEPGTSAFVASVPSRKMDEEISKQVIESGVDVLLSGGEEWLLPEGTSGFYCKSGKRTDGLNLIETAKNNGYHIVYTKDQLLSVPDNVEKLLGIFAEGHIFNYMTEEAQLADSLEIYKKDSPTLTEMTEAAIKILSKNNQQFFLVVEEEGTDNFSNENNARGTIEALKRADDAIGLVQKFIKKNPNTLLVTAADSEAGAMELLGLTYTDVAEGQLAPINDWNGAPADGQLGTGTELFYSAPDQFGNKLPFFISWGTSGDGYGSVIAKAEGMNSELMNGLIDNTFIYKIMYKTLFDK